MKARSLCILLTNIVLILLSTTAQAAEYRGVDKEVNASDILTYIEMGEDINLDNCSIVGELTASKLKTVPNPLYYYLVNLDSNNNLYISSGNRKPLHVIESNITIRNTIFERNVDLSYVLFKNSTFFEGSTFNNSANFKGSIFNNSAYFEKVKFNNSANFEGSTFNNSADFFESTFENSTAYAVFTKSTFNNSANFGAVVFNNSPNFRKATFKDSAYFEDSKFDNATYFPASTFEKGACFSGSIFNDSADFRGSTFNDSADFFGSTFNDFADFDGSTFNSAYFYESTFNNPADFHGSTFNSAYFYESTFNNSADFHGSIFNDSDFGKSTFNYFVDFSLSVFNNFTDFREAAFKDSTYFEESTFVDSAHFEGATFDNSAFLGMPETSENIFTDGRTCELFRKSYNNLARYADANNIYYNFRIESMNDKSISISKLIDFLSWVTCGFGTKLEYTIDWIIGIIIIFAFIYKWDWKTPGIYRASGEDKTEKAKVSFWECLCFSVNTFTRLGTPNWHQRDKFWYAVTIEGILGWVMMAIFLATLMSLLIRP
jgi:hypothetical protein